MSTIRLEFDGLHLDAIDVATGDTVKSWQAISGRPGNQTAAASSMVKALVDARAEKTKEERAATAVAEIDRLRVDGIRADRAVN